MHSFGENIDISSSTERGFPRIIPEMSIDTSGITLNHTSLYGKIGIPKYARVFFAEIN